MWLTTTTTNTLILILPTTPLSHCVNVWIAHYAAKVVYTVDGWLAANRDAKPDALVALLGDRGAPLLREACAAAAPPKGARRKPKTVCGGFVDSMVGLRRVLGASQCSFIRCIKPNAEMKPGGVDRGMVRAPAAPAAARSPLPPLFRRPRARARALSRARRARAR